MLRYYNKQSATEDFRLVHQSGDAVWAHAEQPTDEELKTLTDEYALDPNIVRDLRDMHELPRMEYGNQQLYVFLRTVQRTKHGEVLSTPLLAVVTPKSFVTLAVSNALTERKIIDASHATIKTSDLGSLLLSVFAAVSSDYEFQIHRTGKYIKDIGHRLRTHEVNNADFVHFVTIEDNLNEYSLNLTGMLAVAERLRDNKHQQFSSKDTEALEDVILHIRQLISTVGSHSQSITSIRNAYSTIANNTLNQRMKTLTVLTVLITLPNVFYGMYGMNITLPFAEEPWAYGVIVGFTIFLIFLVYTLAKRFRVF
jgi:magnesium transporter